MDWKQVEDCIADSEYRIQSGETDVWICDVEGKRASRTKSRQLGLAFQVTDVHKPLMAVKRISEKGNIVHFGPNNDDNFIKNIATGDKLPLRPNGKGS